jgi:aerobic carbon-monoxide dehydrogenase small subunit
MTAITLTVNGRLVTAEVAPRTHLADFLRDQLLLTGTHIGCEHGICGACTVEINGEIARSCITYAVACDGAEVRSIESFDDDALMHELRQAFSQQHALQCGYCTPGMLIAARDLVRRKGGLSRRQIRSEMSGNLCRCTGYIGIINAIEQVMAAARAPPGPRAHTAPAWLGPPPGPTATAQPNHRASLAPAQEPALARGGRPLEPAATGSTPRPVRVSVGPIEVRDGLTRVSQRFLLDHAPEVTWELVSDIERLARCLPGLTLDAPPEAQRVAGHLDIKLGPISAHFAGEARFRIDPAARRLSLEGRGVDRKGGSNVSGSLDLRVEGSGVDDTASAIALDLSYALMGPLAQIGRSNIAQDLARRLAEIFARNMQAALTHPGATAPAAAVSGLALLFEVARDRLKTWLRGVLGRRPRA